MNTFYLVGDINEPNTECLLAALHTNSVDKLILCSNGGGLELGLALYDALREHDVQVIGTGQVFSAALLLLLGGERRSATQHTRFMTHPVCVTGESVKSADRNEADLQQRIMAQIIASRCGMSELKANALLGDKNYFGATHAKSLGLIQDIL